MILVKAAHGAAAPVPPQPGRLRSTRRILAVGHIHFVYDLLNYNTDSKGIIDPRESEESVSG